MTEDFQLYKEVGNRIALFIEKMGWTNKEFAEITGIQPAHVKSYLSGKLNPIKFIPILEPYGLDKKWVLIGDEYPSGNAQVVKEPQAPIFGAEEVHDIPLLSEVYAGEPSHLYTEYVGETISFPKTNGHRLFALRVNGDSMETTLKNGDVVVADMDADLIDGCIVAVVLGNGHQYIKRYRAINNNFIQLISDSDKYADKIIAKTDVEKIYRVIHGIVQF